MIEGKRLTLEDRIIHILTTAEITVGELYIKICEQKVSDKKAHVTIQAVYKVIRGLVADGVIVKNGNKFSVSREWTRKVVTTFSRRSDSLHLTVGDSITYSFKDPRSLDSYWKHIMEIIHAEYPHEPTFIYLPHEMWVYVGHEGSDEEYFQSFVERKIPAYVLIGGSTPFDKDMKRRMAHGYLKAHAGNILTTKSQNEHLMIVGDYISITRLGSNIEQKIDLIYRTSKIEQELRERIIELFTKPRRFKIIFERNPTKAAAFRKRMGKYFILS
jgi:hypothetical protein